ncbi:hypothetical protein PTKIN_Ptkin03bG0186100 [Pterospermum kingtungense]
MIGVYVRLRAGRSKNAVESLIELGRFVAGDSSHNQYKEIFEMVDEMQREMERAGYVPSTSEVMLAMDEDDEEDYLNRQSEWPAIAFALINAPPGTRRIVKK